MFPADTYRSRRTKLLEKMRNGVVVLLGHRESPMNYPDNPYHFRQDSTFLYYFGLEQPGLAAILDCSAGTVSLFGDDLTVDDIVWMGTQPSLSERAAACAVDTVHPSLQLAAVISEARAQNRPIHFIPQYRMDNTVLLSHLTGIPAPDINNHASLELILAVVEARNYKSAEEIAEIERAVNTTVDMHMAAMKMVRPGIREAEVAAEVHRVALATGGSIAFPIIATIHGETLHNHYHGNLLKKGDLFLLDAGAETAAGYAGDMSSTIPVSRTFSSRQTDIYQITLDAHEAAIAELAPGIYFRDIHLKACCIIAQGLKDLGFMRGDPRDAVEAGAHALFFPCGLGHMMGLDVHDMENLGEQYVGYAEGMQKSTVFGLKSLRLGRKLEAGFVLTIEPGIYFIPELIRLWRDQKRFTEFIDYEKVSSYQDFGGIRNEEDFLITPDGSRLLGKPLPKTIADVEAVRA